MSLNFYFTKDDDHMMKFDENLINSIKDFLSFNPNPSKSIQL